MNIQEWFKISMKRDIPQLLPPEEPMLDLGAGKTPVAGALSLDYPEWIAPAKIPYSDGTFGTVWASHFLEHLRGEDAIFILREIERVLRPGGTANIVTPYYTSQVQAHDLDHRSVYCEETWRNLFQRSSFAKLREGDWKLEVHACIIIGIVERNIALMTQLRRKA